MAQSVTGPLPPRFGFNLNLGHVEFALDDVSRTGFSEYLGFVALVSFH